MVHIRGHHFMKINKKRKTLCANYLFLETQQIKFKMDYNTISFSSLREKEEEKLKERENPDHL